jgi:hypothetical protein
MNGEIARADRGRLALWTTAVLIVLAPLLLSLWLTVWHTPFPVSEAVALFEDVAKLPSPTTLWVADSPYYRPLFYATLWTIWHNASSIEARLAFIKLVNIVPVLLLVVLLVWHLRPRTFLDAAAAAAAAAVLMGSPGFRDNLEIPLSYTAVGMPMALMVWMVVNRERRWWHGPAIVALALVAIGFKEQGLVIVPLVIAAWWTRAPGVSRRTAAVLTGIAVAYVLFRLQWRDKWPLFEQSIGLGFSILEPGEAAARFGAFPYWVYAYNGLATMANVLFSEPINGTFFIIRDWVHGQFPPAGILRFASSITLTVLITWWGIRSLRASVQTGAWSIESRTFVALLVVLAGCGALSFNYSRDRLGGMAVVFYASAAFFALRAAAAHIVAAARFRVVAAGLALALLAAAWNIRAIGTVESARRTSIANRTQWLIQLPERRAEFGERPVYLSIMQSMIDQGTDPAAPRPSLYPDWIASVIQ